MEGIGGEAASVAGHLKLPNLCWLYDDNKITIEGETSLAFSEDMATRFAGYGWHVVRVDDANDLGALREALQAFHATTDRPTLIVCRSHIAWGAPNAQDTAGAHGAPLGEKEVKLAKKFYGWPEEPTFYVPQEVVAHFQEGLGARGKELSGAWYARFAEYKKAHPELADQIHRRGLRALAWAEKQMGRYSFIAFFLFAYLIAKAVGWALGAAFARSFAFQEWFFAYEWVTIPLVLVLQIGVLVYLMARRIPTWIDNHYKHENRADNMGSLRRRKAESSA